MAPVRRNRVWARTSHIMTNMATGVVNVEDLLSDFRADMGITKNLPGTTIGAIKGRLTWCPDSIPVAGSPDSLLWGIRVGADVDDALDLDPAFLHQDWMLYDRVAWTNNGNVGMPQHIGEVELNGRAMRKLDEIGQTLWLSAIFSGSGTLDLFVSTSVLLILP